jgi:hypothetical protein
VLGQYDERLPTGDFFCNYKNLVTCHIYRVTETRSPFLLSAMLCIRRSVLEEAGGFDGRLERAEDFRLGVTLGSRGYRFIIDRRVLGVHLKRYTFKSILREDWRRLQDMRGLQLEGREQAFAWRAHRPNRLVSLASAISVAPLAAAAFWRAEFGYAAAACWGLFGLANLGFFLYCRRIRGNWFAVRSAAVLWLEMIWAGFSLAVGATRARLRRR